MNDSLVTLEEVGYSPHNPYTYDDETFVTLWERCDSVHQFMESWEHNHRDSDPAYHWSTVPTYSGVVGRRRAIERRYGVTLKGLMTDTQREREISRKNALATALRAHKDRMRGVQCPHCGSKG